MHLRTNFRYFRSVLINLLPEFLAVLQTADREAAFQDYLNAHRSVLSAYWHNYVLDLDSPQASAIVTYALHADRSDLHELLASTDVEGIVEDAIAQSEDLLQVDRPTDVYLMVGMGAANAGELVVGGRGAAFICLEHFTGRANPETYGMGLPPELLPLWVAHEMAHTVRYTSPTSGSELKRLIAEQGGYYDYWATGSRATLRELLVNEGLAVHAAEAVAPGFDPANYFGYPRRQYRRLRELEAFLRRVVEPELDGTGIGLRLRYLSGGMSPSARLVGGRVLPERSGYYLGYRMTEALVAERGIAAALRAPAQDFQSAEDASRGIQTA
ncbi:MAG TPA: DUF2268 domain-containing putative Zn-dependent protease [Gemmatimonadales bacterium]|nr:DUF2268 domain-containing putative Zn-dependent protease [Gemmatimonadales bacterium]